MSEKTAYEALLKQYGIPLPPPPPAFGKKAKKSDHLKSISKPRLTFEDIYTFDLNESDLTEYKVGKSFKTPARDVPCTNGLQWHILCDPAGQNENSKNHIGLYLYVNKEVTANYIFKVNGSFIEKSLTHDFTKDEFGWGYAKFVSHEKLRPLFVDGRVSITCQVEFEISGSNAVMAPRIGQCSEHVPADVDLVVGSERLKVHKSLLSLVSPVFHAMLTNDTAETPSDEIVVTEFDYGTVKTAVDFCYGRALENTSVESIIGVLRFADKYRIKASPLEQVAIFNLKPESFVAALQYSNDLSEKSNMSSKDLLYYGCCDFFRRNTSDVTATNSFSTLSPELISIMLKQTFNVKTQLDVLRTAQKSGITFVLDEWEKPVIEALSLDTFCDTCKYAWGCSRDNMKKECGKFFNDHRVEVLTLKSFADLSSEVVHGVIKVGQELL